MPKHGVYCMEDGTLVRGIVWVTKVDIYDTDEFRSRIETIPNQQIKTTTPRVFVIRLTKLQLSS